MTVPERRRVSRSAARGPMSWTIVPHDPYPQPVRRREIPSPGGHSGHATRIRRVSGTTRRYRFRTMNPLLVLVRTSLNFKSCSAQRSALWQACFAQSLGIPVPVVFPRIRHLAIGVAPDRAIWCHTERLGDGAAGLVHLPQADTACRENAEGCGKRRKRPCAPRQRRVRCVPWHHRDSEPEKISRFFRS
jgi:hypothetical protein